MVFAKTILYTGIQNESTFKICKNNQQTLNHTLNSLLPGDTLEINGIYYLQGGLVIDDIHDVSITLNGELRFEQLLNWPTSKYPEIKTTGGHPVRKIGHYLDCIHFKNIYNVTITSKNTGILNGQGHLWWNIPTIGYVIFKENRPKLLTISKSEHIVIENIYLKQSPYWNIWADEVNDLIIRNITIYARRTISLYHSLLDLTAFNTDGIDLTDCMNVHIYKVSIWVQDDAISIKDGCKNIVVEDANVSGMGLVIGSIGDSTVSNITFQNCFIRRALKGIYIKFRSQGLISNIIFNNIEMDDVDIPIWIGPAQQSNSINICKSNPCSICWPRMPYSTCEPVKNGYVHNITMDILLYGYQNDNIILLDNDSAQTVQIHMIHTSNLNISIYEHFPLLYENPHDTYILIIYLYIFICVCMTIVYCCQQSLRI